MIVLRALWFPFTMMKGWLDSPNTHLASKILLGPFVVLAMLLYAGFALGVMLWTIGLTFGLISMLMERWL
jgi:hypothetical protein